MDVVLYRAKGKDGYLYDISFNPSIDLEILRKTRNVKALEIVTPSVSFDSGQELLRGLYGKTFGFKKLPNSQDFLISSKLKKLNINKVQRDITIGEPIPAQMDISKLEDYVAGRYIALSKLVNKGIKLGYSEAQIINVIQTLYCERRIKMMPAIIAVGNKRVCTICNKEVCEGCCLGLKEDDIILYAADNYNINTPKNIEVKLERTSEIIEKANVAVKNFIRSKKNYGILWSIPSTYEYNAVLEGIAEVVSRGGKVLYSTSTFCTNEAKIAIAEKLGGAIVNIVYGIDNEYKQNDVSICSYSEFPCFYKAFDLVILDQRYAYIDRPSENLAYIYQKAVKEKGKFLNITILPDKMNKSILKNAFDTVTIPIAYLKNPIPEPRIITSKFLNGAEIFFPQMVMDVIRWAMKENSKLIVFAPDEGEVHKIFYYLTNLEGINRDIIDLSNDKDKTSLLKFKRGESKILISTDLKDTMNIIEDINIVVMNSDSSFYDVDTLINIAAMASFGAEKKLREVMFVASEENERLSLAKSCIRSINKMSWEMGYIKR